MKENDVKAVYGNRPIKSDVCLDARTQSVVIAPINHSLLYKGAILGALAMAAFVSQANAAPIVSMNGRVEFGQEVSTCLGSGSDTSWSCSARLYEGDSTLQVAQSYTNLTTRTENADLISGYGSISNGVSYDQQRPGVMGSARSSFTATYMLPGAWEDVSIRFSQTCGASNLDQCDSLSYYLINYYGTDPNVQESGELGFNSEGVKTFDISKGGGTTYLYIQANSQSRFGNINWVASSFNFDVFRATAAVPEPSTWATVGLVALLLIGLKLRSRHNLNRA